jgi:pimeloyl-ACP methyl ester carboxylesterase
MLRPTTLIALLTALALPAAAHADRYVRIAGAPGYGPAKYAKVGIEQIGPRSAKRVLVLIPGTFAGAGDFGLVAHELVKRVPNLQVWAIDRRSNVLEDTSYMVKALHDQITGQQLFDYYLGWIGDSSISPHYQPLKDADFAFARNWGLRVAMEDARRVVLAARRGGRRVILGGHSLGASSTLAYATWDFHGRAGYKDVEGLVVIDGGRFRSAPALSAVKKQVADLKASSPWLDLLGINLPWTSGVFEEAGAIGALKDPDSASIGQASPLLPAQFKPSVPVTNKALYGYAFDYRTSPAALALIHIHSGHVDPTAGPNGLHSWIDDGITPIESFATIAAHEPGNFVEWYYPKRLTIDVQGAGNFARTKTTDYLGLRTWHRRAVDVPLYAFQTSLSDGAVLKGARAFVKASKIPRATYVDRSKTYAHLDPLAATPSRNDFLKTVVPFLRKLR